MEKSKLKDENLFKETCSLSTMSKKCIICDDPAIFKIKDTPDYYCRACAEENFSDLTLLISVEEEALRLKEFLTQKKNEPNDQDRID